MRKPKKLPLEALARTPCRCSVDALPTPIVWTELFGNDHPVEVEIGFRQGTVPDDQAPAGRTELLGVEIVRKYQLYAATRLATRG